MSHLLDIVIADDREAVRFFSAPSIRCLETTAEMRTAILAAFAPGGADARQ